MIEKGMRKVAKMTPTWNSNGSQHQHKIEKCRKNGMPKSMLKNVTFQEVQQIGKIGPLAAKGPPSAPRSVAKPAFLGWRVPGAPRARYCKTTKQRTVGAQSDTPMADGQANFMNKFMASWALGSRANGHERHLTK